MKTRILLLIAYVLYGHALFGNGVVFNKSEIGSYLKLLESSTSVTIESQVASTVTIQSFKNDLEDSITIKYAFPLPEDASATKLRYKINGTWYTASFTAVPQDTSTGSSPDGEEDYNLKDFLGTNPLYFDIVQKIELDSVIEVELTYVELLNYKFGNVDYIFPNNYERIQAEELIKQEFNLTLRSERTIEDIALLSHTATTSTNSGYIANISYLAYEQEAMLDYRVQYSLSLDELGLYSLSIFIDDSLQQDEFSRGFFAFIVEPDPSETTEVIDKVFTLIIDKSGSMSGNKIVQARNAARFIVENLNEGDKFNIITFDSEVTSFRSSHIDYNLINEDAAIDYINSIVADGATNISGAFDKAVPQFSVAGSTTANIIIFFTDGEQTAGITNTDELISHIDDLVNQSEKQISIFTFGIGENTNTRLLTTIASNHSGSSEFLENNELEEVITDFYLMIRNPVLLNTQIEFSPSIINEIYPTLLPNLYKGQQIILVGRYSESADLNISLRGNAFSNDVEYEYTTELSDSMNYEYQFLTKLWAKGKIEDLIDKYYLNLDNSYLSERIKEEVINISLAYGVMSPFTSFHYEDPEPFDAYPASVTEVEFFETTQNKQDELINEYLKVESISPNPCSDYLNVVISSFDEYDGELTLKIIDLNSNTIYNKIEFVAGKIINTYTIAINQFNVPSGIYFLLIEYKGRTISYKIYIY